MTSDRQGERRRRQRRVTAVETERTNERVSETEKGSKRNEVLYSSSEANK